MAFFPRAYYGQADTSFTPLFRLLDDFDAYSRKGGHRSHRNHVPTFQPKFDVREVEDAYELHGELAGMDKDNVHIEFTDPHTLLIRGRVERSYTAGTPPAGLVQDSEMSGAITEGEEKSEPTTPKDTSHQATVEDEVDEQASTTATEQPTPATTVAEVAKTTEKPADSAKYWVSERSIGEFSRSFHFPALVQSDAVTAGLRDGILTVRVPKAKKHESRRIDIN